jgi:hypothetical protein
VGFFLHLDVVRVALAGGLARSHGKKFPPSILKCHKQSQYRFYAGSKRSARNIRRHKSYETRNKRAKILFWHRKVATAAQRTVISRVHYINVMQPPPLLPTRERSSDKNKTTLKYPEHGWNTAIRYYVGSAKPTPKATKTKAPPNNVRQGRT